MSHCELGPREPLPPAELKRPLKEVGEEPCIEETKQAFLKLEEVRETIREAEVELRESAYNQPYDAHRHHSKATSAPAVAARALGAALGTLGRPDETPPVRHSYDQG
jgi:hypothetical protein